ncbi:MAG: dCTP deaminase [Candidatus Melainabacteria bacterium]|nr:dCTP deaminase [Candidatus Melainabacteria bacterium]
MVLSNTEIIRAIESGRLGITPQPEFTVEGRNARFESDTLNLTLAEKLQVIKGGVTFDPSTDDIRQVVRKHSREVVLTDDKPFVLKPGNCVLAMTAERITLRADTDEPPLMGIIEGRSTLGRSFMTVHVTAPFVHAGTDHQIVLEIANIGKWNIVLRRGMNIAQMAFIELSGKPTLRLSQFHGQDLPCGTAGGRNEK